MQCMHGPQVLLSPQAPLMALGIPDYQQGSFKPSYVTMTCFMSVPQATLPACVSKVNLPCCQQQFSFECLIYLLIAVKFYIYAVVSEPVVKTTCYHGSYTVCI